MIVDEGKWMPWTVDSAGVNVASLPSDLFASAEVRRFLKADIGDAGKILVAPKGFGKTLFLKWKALLVRKKLKNAVPIHPDATSEIEFLKISLEWREFYHDVRQLSDDTWSLLWQFVLILKSVQMTTPASDIGDVYLKQLLANPRETIGGLLTSVLRDQDNLSTNLTQRLPTLRNLFNNSERDAVIFIDNVDEMFEGLEQNEATKETQPKATASRRSVQQHQELKPVSEGQQQSSSPIIAKTSPSLWKAAQVGLLLAVREIERSVRKLNVYASLRAEAVHTSEHYLALQARTHTVPIKYSRDDLEEIFGWHVSLMDVDDLVSSAANTAEESLVGSGQIVHPYVCSSEGLPESENLLDLIIRHTNYSPRELVTIGGAVASLSRRERRLMQGLL